MIRPPPVLTVAQRDAIAAAHQAAPHIVRAETPDGRTLYCPSGGEPTEDRAAAFVYNNRAAAWKAARRWGGSGEDAFWESERQSAAAQAKRFKGWTFKPEVLTPVY